MTETFQGILAELSEEISARPLVYLVTVGTDSHPHTAQVNVSQLRHANNNGVTELHLQVSLLGRTSHKNVTAGSQLSLMWPPLTSEGYTLIINGHPQEVSEGTLTLSVTKAVLHRPGEVPEGTTLCGSDCIPLWN